MAGRPGCNRRSTQTTQPATVRQIKEICDGRWRVDDRLSSDRTGLESQSPNHGISVADVVNNNMEENKKNPRSSLRRSLMRFSSLDRLPPTTPVGGVGGAVVKCHSCGPYYFQDVGCVLLWKNLNNIISHYSTHRCKSEKITPPPALPLTPPSPHPLQSTRIGASVFSCVLNFKLSHSRLYLINHELRVEFWLIDIFVAKFFLQIGRLKLLVGADQLILRRRRRRRRQMLAKHMSSVFAVYHQEGLVFQSQMWTLQYRIEIENRNWASWRIPFPNVFSEQPIIVKINGTESAASAGAICWLKWKDSVEALARLGVEKWRQSQCHLSADFQLTGLRHCGSFPLIFFLSLFQIIDIITLFQSQNWWLISFFSPKKFQMFDWIFEGINRDVRQLFLTLLGTDNKGRFCQLPTTDLHKTDSTRLHPTNPFPGNLMEREIFPIFQRTKKWRRNGRQKMAPRSGLLPICLPVRKAITTADASW